MMRPVVLLTALLWSVAVPASAQTARVNGVILDSAGGGLSGVEVLVLGSDLRTTSGDGGKFTLAGLPAGRITLQTRRIGYKPVEVMADLDPLREATVSIRMMAEGVVLPEIAVEGRSFKPAKYATTTKYDDFFRHKRSGFGTLISREEIEKMNAFHTVDILRSIPGVNVTMREADPLTARVRFARCSGRSANVDVYLDGRLQIVRDSVAVAGFEQRIGGMWGSRISVALASISAPHIEMIEVFRGASEIPGEYNSSNACAVIAIWTRWN